MAGEVTLARSDDVEVGGVREPTMIARALWPIEELERRYHAFIEAYEGVMPFLESLRDQGAPLHDSDFLPGALEMAVVFAQSFDIDPLLPPQLLPSPWPGSEVRELLLRSRRLALEIREAQGRPALFHSFDETLEDFS